MLALDSYCMGEYRTTENGDWVPTYRCPDPRSATRSLRVIMEEKGFPRGDWDDIALDLMLGRVLQSPNGWFFRVVSRMMSE